MPASPSGMLSDMAVLPNAAGMPPPFPVYADDAFSSHDNTVRSLTGYRDCKEPCQTEGFIQQSVITRNKLLPKEPFAAQEWVLNNF